jgi:hypothetical protein
MQFLNVMDFGAGESLVGWDDALLESVLGKIAELLDAGYASIRTTGGSRYRPVAVSVGSLQETPPLTMDVRDRDAALIGVAEFRASASGVAFTEASERRLRDFDKVLGLLLEMCMRTKSGSGPN